MFEEFAIQIGCEASSTYNMIQRRHVSRRTILQRRMAVGQDIAADEIRTQLKLDSVDLFGRKYDRKRQLLTNIFRLSSPYGGWSFINNWYVTHSTSLFAKWNNNYDKLHAGEGPMDLFFVFSCDQGGPGIPNMIPPPPHRPRFSRRF